MNVYDFTGHLSPLPPGVKLPLQLSGKVCLASDVADLYAEVIKMAAELARGSGLPPDDNADHKPRRSRWYWLGELEKAHDCNRELAVRLRKIADRLSPSAGCSE